MRAVIQLVSNSSVKIVGDAGPENSIGYGLTVLVAASALDTEKEAEKTIDKILKLRIFPDGDKKMNLNIIDARGEILLIPQFTLYGDLKGNNRPNFSKAAMKDNALKLFTLVETKLREKGVSVKTGFFGEHMVIKQELDGPVTIILDTEFI